MHKLNEKENYKNVIEQGNGFLIKAEKSGNGFNDYQSAISLFKKANDLAKSKDEKHQSIYLQAKSMYLFYKCIENTGIKIFKKR